MTTVFLLVLGSPSSLQADLILDVLDAQLAAGGTGFVDVLIRSNSTDNLALFNYEFLITDIGVPVGDLRFSNPQTLTESGFANYVFFGDSAGITSVPQNGPAFDQITGGDQVASFGGVNLTTANRLFARLDLEHVLPGGTPAAAAIGDQFTVSLVGTNSEFLDNGLTPVTLASNSSGTITMLTSAVPEPSTFALFALLSVAGIHHVRKKRRHIESASTEQMQIGSASCKCSS